MHFQSLKRLLKDLRLNPKKLLPPLASLGVDLVEVTCPSASRAASTVKTVCQKLWIASRDYVGMGLQDLRFIKKCDLAGFPLKRIERRRFLERVSRLKVVHTNPNIPLRLEGGSGWRELSPHQPSLHPNCPPQT